MNIRFGAVILDKVTEQDYRERTVKIGEREFKLEQKPVPENMLASQSKDLKDKYVNLKKIDAKDDVKAIHICEDKKTYTILLTNEDKKLHDELNETDDSVRQFRESAHSLMQDTTKLSVAGKKYLDGYFELMESLETAKTIMKLSIFRSAHMGGLSIFVSTVKEKYANQLKKVREGIQALKQLGEDAGIQVTSSSADI